MEACVRTSEMQIALEQKRGGDKIGLPWGAKEMRERDGLPRSKEAKR